MTTGFKKFWDCREDAAHALRNGRTPKVFPTCVSEVVGHDVISIHKDVEGVADKIDVKQMKAPNGTPCECGISPVMKCHYQSHKTYYCWDFAGYRGLCNPNRGIHFYKTEYDAWAFLNPFEGLNHTINF